MRTGEGPFLITGGSDMRIRFWDIGNPANVSNCRIVVKAAADPSNQTDVTYKLAFDSAIVTIVTRLNILVISVVC